MVMGVDTARYGTMSERTAEICKKIEDAMQASPVDQLQDCYICNYNNNNKMLKDGKIKETSGNNIICFESLS